MTPITIYLSAAETLVARADEEEAVLVMVPAILVIIHRHSFHLMGTLMNLTS